MSIYDVNGNEVIALFDVNGKAVDVYYDIEGNAHTLVKTPIGELVAMSFNVGSWNSINESPTRLRNILNEYNPDLVGFQEYAEKTNTNGQQITAIIGERFGNFESTPTGGSTRLAIGSPKYALNNAETLYFSTGRPYQRAYITFGGKNIALFNVHLTWVSETATERITEAKELFDAVASEEYFVIIGDLNTTCESTADRDYVQELKQFVDAGYNLANCTPTSNIAYRYPATSNLKYDVPTTGNPGFVYTKTDSTVNESKVWYAHDNIITSANIEITSTEVDVSKFATSTTVAFDHFPVISYLTVYE